MKKLQLFVFILFSLQVAGQSLSDTITVKGNGFYQHDIRLNINQLQQAVQANSQAYQLIKKAKTGSTVAMAFGYAGGAFIGYPLGTMIGGGKPNWALAGIGAGLLIIAIPISISATKNVKQGVALFNGSLSDKAFLKQKIKPEFKIGITDNGIGVVMRF